MTVPELIRRLQAIASNVDLPVLLSDLDGNDQTAVPIDSVEYVPELGAVVISFHGESS